MPGEGHIADMITRMKNNRELKEQRKEHQKKLNELFLREHHHSGDSPIADVKISEENLQKIKSGIKAKLNLESQSVFRNTLLISILVIAAIVAIVYWGFVE